MNQSKAAEAIESAKSRNDERSAGFYQRLVDAEARIRRDDAARAQIPPDAEPPDIQIVRALSAKQFRYTLIAMGFRDQWEDRVAKSDRAVRDYWTTETRIPETNPKMKRVAISLGIDLADIFDKGSKL